MTMTKDPPALCRQGAVCQGDQTICHLRVVSCFVETWHVQMTRPRVSLECSVTSRTMARQKQQLMGMKVVVVVMVRTANTWHGHLSSMHFVALLGDLEAEIHVSDS